MIHALVTGYNGFIGKHLIAALAQYKDVEIIRFGRTHSLDDLDAAVQKADFIFHLAGINRPQAESEFETGNVELTQQMIASLKKHHKSVPVLFTSSAQAEWSNPYGGSKFKAETALTAYAEETGAATYLYRLPNVFGKWCKPNYNSVVATWCYNIANNLPITIHNESSTLHLVYIDDVVAEFMKIFRDGNVEQGYQMIPQSFEIQLGELATVLRSFKDSRHSLVLPNLENQWIKRLYSTYLSYLDETDFGYNLDMKHDPRGWLAEFIKSEQFGQIFISRTKPGITRGNHWHHTKVEKFLVIEGSAMIRFRSIHDESEVLEYPVSGEQLKVLDIPPGYTHAIENVGKTDVITLFWANEMFNINNPDTIYLEV